MAKLTDKQSSSKIINNNFSSSTNVQKYMKGVLEKAEKEVDKIEQDIKNFEDNN